MVAGVLFVKRLLVTAELRPKTSFMGQNPINMEPHGPIEHVGVDVKLAFYYIVKVRRKQKYHEKT